VKVLISIKGCEADILRGFNQVIRDTWGKDVTGADLRFFVGEGNLSLRQDEVRLTCPDDYMSLPLKTWAILRWAISQDYTNVFLCDTDTFVIPEALLAYDFQTADLIGMFNGPIGDPRGTESKWAWISGGNGYWLSRKAMEIIIHSDPPHWAEDCSVGQVLGPYIQSGAIKARHDINFGFHDGPDQLKTVITSHFCSVGMKRPFDPQWMYQKYAYNNPEKAQCR